MRASDRWSHLIKTKLMNVFMRILPRLAVTLAALGLGWNSGLTAAPAEHEASAALQKFVSEVNTLSGRFIQTQTDEHGEVLSAGEGKVAIARPGRFRWTYVKPYEQLMVCDGKKIWAYDPDLAQVTVRPAGEALVGTPAELLSNNAQLGANFRVKNLGQKNGLDGVLLEPRAAQSDFKSIELWLADGVPRRLRFSDPLGGVTEVQLLDMVVNQEIPGAHFEFQVPKGTEVIEAADSQ